MLKNTIAMYNGNNARDCFVRHVNLYPETDIQTQRMFMCGEAEYEELQKSERNRNYIADPLTYFKCMLMLSSDYVKTREKKKSKHKNDKSHDYYYDYSYSYSYGYGYDYEYYESESPFSNISNETTSTPGPFVSHRPYPNNYENNFETVGTTTKPKL